jgi:ribosomal protein S4
MAIIVDKHDGRLTQMADDGNGHSISIPSFMIEKRDGDSIKEAIHEAKVEEINADKKKKEEAENKDDAEQPNEDDTSGSDDKTEPEGDEEADGHKNRNWANSDEADR